MVTTEGMASLAPPALGTLFRLGSVSPKPKPKAAIQSNPKWLVGRANRKGLKGLGRSA